MNFHNVVFETSYATSDALPESDLLEIAFAKLSKLFKKNKTEA